LIKNPSMGLDFDKKKLQLLIKIPNWDSNP
jgi:hypothetical protein